MATLCWAVLKQVVKDLQSEASETRKNQKDMKKSIEALKVKLIAQAELFRTRYKYFLYVGPIACTKQNRARFKEQKSAS